MKINDRVKTEYGDGTIIGFDLSNSNKAKRCIIKLDKWKGKHNFLTTELYKELCYSLRDVRRQNRRKNK